MTLSVLLRDPRSGLLGGATATGGLAVGAWVLHASVDAGVVVTQGRFTNPLWGEAGLRRLGTGLAAGEVLDALVAEDPGRGVRQLALLDRDGGSAAHTGGENVASAGSRCGDQYAIAGNMLGSATVLDAMERSVLETVDDTPFAWRLLGALRAGVAEGGDSRGELSAALRVVRRDFPPLDLRVDHARDPLSELERLLRLGEDEDFLAFAARLPTLEDPHRC